jgi:uncharacterized protein YdhG (YjbR/CyaY superfamily)
VKRSPPPKPAATIDEYIAASPREVQPILRKIRSIIRTVAPDAVETISYRMPSFKLNGALIYFAPFTRHIGIYPPVRGDADLARDLSGYRGEKGNLKFPLDAPMPYPLIRRVVQARLDEHLARLATKRRTAAP